MTFATRVAALATALALAAPAAAHAATPSPALSLLADAPRTAYYFEPDASDLDLVNPTKPDRNPTVALLFSAVVPGAGQVYNGEFFPKAVLVWTSLAFFSSAYILGSNAVRAAEQQQVVSYHLEYQLGVYLGLAGIAATWIYAVADAYGSAHALNEFKKDQENVDHTLSRRGGQPVLAIDPAGGVHGGYTWRF